MGGELLQSLLRLCDDARDEFGAARAVFDQPGDAAAGQVAAHRVALAHGAARQHRCARGHEQLRAGEALVSAHGERAAQQAGERSAGEFAEFESVSQRKEQPPQRAPAFEALHQFVCNDALGQAVNFAGHDDIGKLRLAVARRGGFGQRAFRGQQKARAHGDSRCAQRQRRHQPAAIAEAARRHHRGLHGFGAGGHQQRGGDAAGVAAAFAALHDDGVCAELLGLLRVARRAAGGNAQHAAILQAADQRGGRRAVVARRAHAVFQNQLHNALRPRRVHEKIHAEGALRERARALNARRHFGNRQGGGGQKAESAGVAGGGHQFRRRHPAHAGLHNGRRDAEQIAEPRVQGRSGGHFLSPALRCWRGLRDL